MDNLILFITNKCNLRCFYCPVEKNKQSMSLAVAKKSIDFYLKQPGKKKHIRFFGGEPFLEFELVKQVIKYAKKEAKSKRINLTFDITSNGTLLDKNKIDFIGTNKEVGLIISLDGKENDQLKNRQNPKNKINSSQLIRKFLPDLLKLKNLTINMVIAPNQVNNFYSNFVFLVKIGFKNFNFLPAYYIFWPEKSLRILNSQFIKIAKLIMLLNLKNRGIKIKNMVLKSDTPLFNEGLVVGYNGDLYLNNLVFSKFFSKLKDKFKIGNIKDLGKFKSIKSFDQMEIIEKYLDKSLYKSTLAVDDILSDFVKELMRSKAIKT